MYLENICAHLQTSWCTYMIYARYTYVTFVLCDSDVRLYVSVARQDVAIGAALGLLRWLCGGQHVSGGGCFLW